MFKFFWLSSAILNPEPASDVIRLEELGLSLNHLSQLFKVQFEQVFNIVSGYLSPPTRLSPITGLQLFYRIITGLYYMRSLKHNLKMRHVCFPLPPRFEMWIARTNL